MLFAIAQKENMELAQPLNYLKDSLHTHHLSRTFVLSRFWGLALICFPINLTLTV